MGAGKMGVGKMALNPLRFTTVSMVSVYVGPLTADMKIFGASSKGRCL